LVASNQSGVARGYFSYPAVEELNRKIIADLAGRGIRIEEIAFCPHHPEGTVTEFAKACACRKPEPGMLREMARKYGVDLSRSYMVGDSEGDALAGLNAGAQGVLIRPDAARRIGGNHVDNPRKIKEFASLLDFAGYLRDFA
jgi:D-glycero-D-manno-heptose 1,7-bisphosphate phosphatase